MRTAVKREKTIEELEQELRDISLEIYNRGTQQIQPTWPWVLIRTLPKEQMVGGIILPDVEGPGKQNKPLHEGIVLALWEPHWSRYQFPGIEYKDGREHWRESEFKIGDRVLFPHFAGLPVKPWFDEHHYRLIREWTFDPNGGAMCTVNYEGDEEMKRKLNEVFKYTTSVTTSGN